MQDAHAMLNQRLVSIFHHILHMEERSLREPGISLREIHVIEAVCQAPDPRMTALAQALHITAGSLSVAVTTLERKGYLLREQAIDDRRVIYVRPTEKALRVYEKHRAFHWKMAEAAMGFLDENQLAILMEALTGIDQYVVSQREA